MQTFEAKLDDLSKIITYVVAFSMVVMLFLLGNIAAHGTPEVLIPLAIVIIILAIALLFRVKSYVLTPDALQVVRPSGSRTFPRSSLKSARPVTTKELGFGIRLFGSGGWGGWFGTFLYKNIGKAQVYATDRSKFLLLRTTDGKQIIVSPVDTEGFLKALKLPKEALVESRR